MKLIQWIVVSGILLFSFPLFAQEPSRLRERIRQQTLKRFDENGDGKLSVSEREKAQAFLRERFSDKDVGPQSNIQPIVDPRTTPLYHLNTGPFKIDDRDFNLSREAGESSLPVKITFPKFEPAEEDATPVKLPVIIFSHGAGGSRDTYQPLIHFWVSHGYVVLQPTHGDSLSLLSVAERQQIRLKSYVTDGGIGKYLIPRTRDIKLILDRLDEIQANLPDLKYQLDKERIGLGGHSFGAYTTQLIGGMTLLDPRTKQRGSYSDPRPATLLMISPQGLGGQIDRQSFVEMTRPAMVLTGSHDDGVLGQPASWRLDAFSELPAETKYLTYIEGAVHNFGGISGVNYLGSGEPNEDHVYFVKSSTLAFWDSQLKSDLAATEYLDSGKLQHVTNWVARISTTVQVKPAIDAK